MNVDHGPSKHVPRRDDDVAAWLKRMRDRWPRGTSGPGPFEAIARVLDRYCECADYGLSLRPEDDEAGDP
jgi:hypothetical protein